MSISCFPIPEDPCAWSYSRQEWVLMPPDGHRYGWSIVRELWVKLPADNHRYGWSIVREVWVRQPNPTYFNIDGRFIRVVFDHWDGTEWMASVPSDEDDFYSDEPHRDYQAEGDDDETRELEEDGLMRVRRLAGPIPFPRPIFRNV